MPLRILKLSILCLALVWPKDVEAKLEKVNHNALSGGEGSVDDQTSQAFTLPLKNLPVEKLRSFTFGNRLFNTNWVTAPSSVKKFDGLGPTFNRVSCSACHMFDGRGRPPDSGQSMESMLVRLSIPGVGEHGGVNPHPHYGDQLNDRAIRGVPAEGRVEITYSEIKGKYPDGQEYSLRVPSYRFVDLAFGLLDKEVMFSPRVAPAVIGLGLLETVEEKTIRSFERKQYLHPDKVSGRVNIVWDEVNQQEAIGRFGWKANQPNLAQQDAGAFVGDIGITNPIFHEENIPDVQHIAKKMPTGGLPELDQESFDKLVFYTRVLAVPIRRNVKDPVVMRGERLFKKIGCAVCHIPMMKTGENKAIPQLAHQKIYPYTDLLLHDMGDGLSDGRPDFLATGNEWRTPPLWGSGLVRTVNKHTFFLHDGRARNFEEAILWHGGEAEISKGRFKQLPYQKRQELIAFLESL